MNFPTDEQFDKAVIEAIKFRNLPLGIYHIEKAKPVETHYGEGLILDLTNKEHKKFTATH